MKLGVIGSGNIGKAIGSWAAKVGYEVTFSAKNEAGAKAASQAAGHSAKAANVRGAVETADLVLLAVPYGAVKEVLTEIRPLLRGKTVIDATNALSADFSSLTLGFTTSAAEEIAKLVPEAHVVKAFNTAFAQVYASQNPKIQGKAISVFVAGDNKEDAEKAQTLITKMGFDVVNAGQRAKSRATRHAEYLTWIWTGPGDGHGIRASEITTYERASKILSTTGGSLNKPDIVGNSESLYKKPGYTV